MSKENQRIGAATLQEIVLKENMSEKVLAIQKTPEYVTSRLRITAYKDHNKSISEEFKQRIHILDDKYASYIIVLDFIQISIIMLAAFSSFLQAGNNIINLDQNVIRFISLIISTYTGLVLAVAKYKKLDEKKESINNLRYQCAGFLTQIQTRTDKLNTWCYDRMWAGGDITKMAETWKTEDQQLYNELKPIIEKKQTLTCEFERILDSLTVKKTSRKVRARDLKFKKQSIEFAEIEDNLEEQVESAERMKKRKKKRDFYNDERKTAATDDRDKEDKILHQIKKYRIGDKVMTKFTSSSSKYYSGEISRVKSDGTYTIFFDDGSRREGVKLSEIKEKTTEVYHPLVKVSKKDKDTMPKFIKNMKDPKLKSLYEQLTSASCQLTEKDIKLTRYKIEIDERDKSYQKLKQYEKNRRIRFPSPDPEGKTTKPLLVGDRVKSRYNNSHDYHLGEIVKENKDGTYKVLFDKKAWEDEDPEAENAYSQKEDRYLNYIPRKEIKFMSRKKGENISIDIKNTKLTVK